MSILTHPDWPVLRPYIRIERYSRDTGPRGARVRLEVERPEKADMLRQLLSLQMRCVACGVVIHPVRRRQGSQELYFAGTCDLTVTRGCARGEAIRAEYRAVRKAVEDWHTQHPTAPAQSDLPLDEVD